MFNFLWNEQSELFKTTTNSCCFKNVNIEIQPRIVVVYNLCLNRQKGNIVFTH